jgi:small-conductance mechanosensitive channel
METIKNIYLDLREYLNVPIVKIGNTELTLWTLVFLVIFLFLLFYLTAKLRKWLVNNLLAKSKLELGVRLAIGAIFRYAALVIGLIIGLQTVGIDLSTITILFGALGVGIGFGLQNITNNFVSGIIILFERPIKVGDRIEVENVSGDVINISMRATTILTNDNIAIIVPNSDFISSKVINWSYTNRNVRFNFPVSVSYSEDPEKVKRILLSIANDNNGVLKEPKPDVLIDEFAESSIKFNLRIWTREFIDRPGVLKSQIYYEIFKRFKNENIQIPFPQVDVHLTGDEKLKR